MKQFWKGLRKGFKYALLITLGYLTHVALEAFVVTNALALFGVNIPILV